MTDKVDLLEAIGRDASLRHAPLEELGQFFASSGADAPLAAALASGDPSVLAEAFGFSSMQATQVTFGPAHEDEDESEGEEGDGEGDEEGRHDLSHSAN